MRGAEPIARVGAAATSSGALWHHQPRGVRVLMERTVVISAPASAVWEALTDPALMRVWMGEPEMDVDVDTTWVVGSAIVVRGFHHLPFENRGKVLALEPSMLLRYSHLSSLSRLPDVPASYSVLEFRLARVSGSTSLTLTITGFPTEAIFKHLELYWRGTLEILKRFVEAR